MIEIKDEYQESIAAGHVLTEKHENLENEIMEEIIRERSNHLEFICRKFKNEENRKLTFDKNENPKFLDLESKNLLLATIPKVGCTNWKKVFMYVKGDISTELRQEVLERGLVAINGAAATEYGNENFVKNVQKMKSVISKREKMVVVREPFERLLSAYRNKIEPNRSDFFGTISKNISNKFRKDEKDKSDRSGKTTFSGSKPHTKSLSNI